MGEHKFYANSNIEDPTEIRKRVFLGEETQLELGKEILEVTEANCDDFFGQNGQQYFGRLVILRGVTCRYGTGGVEHLSRVDVYRHPSGDEQGLVPLGVQQRRYEPLRFGAFHL